MGLIRLPGGEGFPVPEPVGRTLHFRQPDGEEPYQPLLLSDNGEVTLPPVDEEAVEQPAGEAQPQEAAAPVVAALAEPLHLFIAPASMFASLSLSRADATASPAPPPLSGESGALREPLVTPPAEVSLRLARLSPFPAPLRPTEAVVMPPASAGEASHDKPPLPVGRQPVAHADAVSAAPVIVPRRMPSPLPHPPSGLVSAREKTAVSVLPLPAHSGAVSEQEPALPDLKALLLPTQLTAAAKSPEYQWAPLRLADQPQQWGRQLVELLRDKVELQLNQQVKQAHIRLDPPELGRLELTVRLDGDRLNIQLNATQPAVREALLQSMERLRLSLAPHHAGGVEVNVGQQGDRQQQDHWQQEQIKSGRRQWQDGSEAAGEAGQEWLDTLV